MPTVLYVEDDEGDRFFMERAFARAGMASALQMVHNGQSAVHYLSGAGPYGDRSQFPVPDLVLLDLNLPLVSGFEVLQWMRQQQAYLTLPVVVFSASIHDDDRGRAKTLGANDYLQKPASGLQYGKILDKVREKWLSPPAAPPPDSGQPASI